MAHTNHGPENFLGLRVQGDVGAITYYTSSRNKLVAFIKSPPLSPPTITQQHMRNLFRLAGRTWRALTPATRALWARVAARAHLRATGFNLWVWYQRTNDRAQLETFFRLAGEDLT